MSNPALAGLDARIFSTFGAIGLGDTAATFTRGITSVPCTIMIDDGVQLLGDQSQVVDNKTTVTARLAEIGSVPARGDKFTTLAGRVLTVDAVIDKDTSIVVCVIKDGC
jgi:hypothetical protein